MHLPPAVNNRKYATYISPGTDRPVLLSTEEPAAPSLSHTLSLQHKKAGPCIRQQLHSSKKMQAGKNIVEVIFIQYYPVVTRAVEPDWTAVTVT